MIYTQYGRGEGQGEIVHTTRTDYGTGNNDVTIYTCPANNKCLITAVMWDFENVSGVDHVALHWENAETYLKLPHLTTPAAAVTVSYFACLGFNIQSVTGLYTMPLPQGFYMKAGDELILHAESMGGVDQFIDVVVSAMLWRD